MLRIAVSVEGATEREFISQVLQPYFFLQNKYLLPVDMRGNISLDKIKNELVGLLYSFDYITTLYDFYGFKKRGNRSVNELEVAINALVPTKKQAYFIPYIQQYEFEALLFSDPDIMANYLGNTKYILQLKQIIQECGGAKKINDSFYTYPNRRTSQFYPAFNKKLDGPEICKKIGLSMIRKHCPRFDNWINQLEGI